MAVDAENFAFSRFDGCEEGGVGGRGGGGGLEVVDVDGAFLAVFEVEAMGGG